MKIKINKNNNNNNKTQVDYLNKLYLDRLKPCSVFIRKSLFSGCDTNASRTIDSKILLI